MQQTQAQAHTIKFKALTSLQAAAAALPHLYRACGKRLLQTRGSWAVMKCCAVARLASSDFSVLQVPYWSQYEKIQLRLLVDLTKPAIWH